MLSVVLKGIFLPLLGTCAGSACVFFMKGALNKALMQCLNGFASGVMIAASVWSLIIPAIEQSENMGCFSCVPAVAGVWLGVIFFIILSRIAPDTPTPPQENSEKSMLTLAVVLHNIPEGMAIGVAIAAYLKGVPGVTGASAVALATGIEIQNFPEGSIISMPLGAKGMAKSSAFVTGALSGVVEPVATVATILLASIVTPVLPYMLSFAAGAMLFVAASELIPHMNEKNRPHMGTVFFSLGFTLMMALDVALG